jgi:hypothetical protein
MSGAKATAWKWFAKYIKLRDALETTGDTQQARCYTCGELHPVEEMDAGHAIAGRTNGILFDEDIVKAQCRRCNRLEGGQSIAFKWKLIQEHGADWYAIKLQNKRTPTKLDEFDLRHIAETYRRKCKELLK